MNYIINPSWFYWLGVVNSMRGFMLAAFIVAIIIVGAALILIPWYTDMIREFPTMWSTKEKQFGFLQRH